MASFLNDHFAETPKLRIYPNFANLVDLRADTIWPRFEGLPHYRCLMADGFVGVQLTTDEPCAAEMPMPVCGLDRINDPTAADAAVANRNQNEV